MLNEKNSNKLGFFESKLVYQDEGFFENIGGIVTGTAEAANQGLKLSNKAVGLLNGMLEFLADAPDNIAELAKKGWAHLDDWYDEAKHEWKKPGKKPKEYDLYKQYAKKIIDNNGNEKTILHPQYRWGILSKDDGSGERKALYWPDEWNNNSLYRWHIDAAKFHTRILTLKWHVDLEKSKIKPLEEQASLVKDKLIEIRKTNIQYRKDSMEHRQKIASTNQRLKSSDLLPNDPQKIRMNTQIEKERKSLLSKNPLSYDVMWPKAVYKSIEMPKGTGNMVNRIEFDKNKKVKVNLIKLANVIEKNLKPSKEKIAEYHEQVKILSFWRDLSRARVQKDSNPTKQTELKKYENETIAILDGYKWP